MTTYYYVFVIKNILMFIEKVNAPKLGKRCGLDDKRVKCINHA